jgi:hypothetical protein
MSGLAGDAERKERATAAKGMIFYIGLAAWLKKKIILPIQSVVGA